VFYPEFILLCDIFPRPRVIISKNLFFGSIILNEYGGTIVFTSWSIFMDDHLFVYKTYTATCFLIFSFNI